MWNKNADQPVAGTSANQSSQQPSASSPKPSIHKPQKEKEEGAIAGKLCPFLGRCHRPMCAYFQAASKHPRVSWVFSRTHKPSCFSSSLSQTTLFTSKEVQSDVRLLYTIAGAYVTAKFYQLEIQIGKQSQKTRTDQTARARKWEGVPHQPAAPCSGSPPHVCCAAGMEKTAAGCFSCRNTKRVPYRELLQLWYMEVLGLPVAWGPRSAPLYCCQVSRNWGVFFIFKVLSFRHQQKEKLTLDFHAARRAESMDWSLPLWLPETEGCCNTCSAIATSFHPSKMKMPFKTMWCCLLLCWSFLTAVHQHQVSTGDV